ncbi:uncharacterized protein B0I36DRAFT_393420 [Microdochium trichocladiopsis]|uniref:Apple domain-containing protein n=1 Tax=Microdochium trichocladiopsis TaxID=1682393 RepID=A0A9P8XWG2_9PEZI|nr:uncharacterized protein B0I36DRAFT_393420 [Microdochium trichocladiopsis]KAH7021171.1 hypothetical protein B0I36DRAFT_393420 [Microdochium trichocladiopsis]
MLLPVVSYLLGIATLVAGQNPPRRFFIQVNAPGIPPFLLGPAPLPPAPSPSSSVTSSSEAGAVCTSLSTAYVVSTVVTTTTESRSVVTSYVTVTSGDLLPVVTATETVFVTNTLTEATGSVSTTTATTTPPTITVPTPAGFTPLNDYPPVGRRRGMPEPRDDTKADPACTSTTSLTTTIFSTATETSTVEADAPIATTTLTTTVSATGAAGTEPETASSVITSTITTTTTSLTIATETAQSEAPTPTVYAQCAPDNLRSTFNGRGIADYQPVNLEPYTTEDSLEDSAEDCCAKCAAVADCFGSAYLESSGECEILIGDNSFACNPAQTAFEYYRGSGPGVVYTLSNGNCGKFALAT